MTDPQLFLAGFVVGGLAAGVAAYKHFPRIVKALNRVEAAREKLQAALREL